MLWTRCGCDVRLLVRLDRSLWMRAFPDRRRYYCPGCASHQFLSRASVRQALPGAVRPELDADETTHATLDQAGSGPLPDRL